MAQYSRIAHALREQIHGFVLLLAVSLSKPKARFVEEMVYGIQASQDVKLSSIGRALEEGIRLKKTVERLSWHAGQPGLGEGINGRVAMMGSRRVHRDTLLIVDPSDIRKEYAKRMPYLATVRDGSTGELAPGYWTCPIVACESSSRRMTPLHLSLWSSEAPDFVSENEQILSCVDTVRGAVADRGIWVIDRGGDRENLLHPFLDRKMRFIVRMKGDRHLLYRGRAVAARALAAGCPLPYAEVIVREEEKKEKTYHLEFGYRQVRFPGGKKTFSWWWWPDSGKSR